MSKDIKEKDNIPAEEIIIDIPDDEVYTYRIPGLAAPHIGKTYDKYTLKKVIFIAVIIVAVSLSMFFSLMILQTEPFTYKQLDDGTYQFTKFSNPGYIYELEIDYVREIVYDKSNKKTADIGNEPEIEYHLLGEAPLLETKEELLAFQQKENDAEAPYNEYHKNRKTPDFTVEPDTSKPITSVKAYTLNCDGYIKKIKIGPTVTDIDNKAFYSCWALQYIEVDENNPNYCDIDGVLYTKDKKTVVCYPCDRDQYLRDKYNYPRELGREVPKDHDGKELMTAEDYAPIFEEYKTLVMTYAIPETVETVGELCFNYANLATVYLPEKLKVIENLGFFEMPNMKDFYTYKTDAPLEGTEFVHVKDCERYLSLPEGLTYIGTDAFSYNKEMEYIYIPESVEYIGHHAFWDTSYNKDGEIMGLRDIHLARSEEDIKANVETGDQWIPIYNHNALKKLPVTYSAERRTIE